MNRLLSSVDFWEMRQGSVLSNSISVSNGDVKDLSVSRKSGTSIRVLDKGRWGFAYSETSTANEIAKRAVAIAKSLEVHRLEIPDLGALKGRFGDRPRIDPETSDAESIVRKLKSIHQESASSFSTDFQSTKRNISYMNSHGSELSQELAYTSVYMNASVKKNGRHEQFDNKVGGQGGLEILNRLPEAARTTVKKAEELCSAKQPKGGRFSVVCDPVLVDVLIHEAFGHAAEADGIISQESCLTGMLGDRLASDEVSIVDDATLKGRWGSFHFDDEGIRSQKTHILKKGMLVGFLHSRETAAELGAKPTGNARAEGISSEPVVRMSNTNIQRGNHDDEELFDGIKRGMFLCGSSGGQVDTAKGNFQFNSRYGYEIVNGKLGKALTGASLQGNTLEMLSNISAVGKKISPGLPGFCGKFGQFVPVLGINPMVRLDKAIVGGSG